LLRRFAPRTVFIAAKPMTVIASEAKQLVYLGEANLVPLTLILTELVYLGEANMRGLAPHLSMKPKASS
jgi:hypothetical protein